MVDVLFRGNLVKDIVLVPIRTGPNGPTQMLAQEAAGAFTDMDQAAKRDGITLDVNTSFRTVEHQTRLYQQYVVDLAAGRNPSIVAPPGQSYHEIGLAVDISTKGQGKASPIYKWLEANGPTYGFKNTVPDEPWHWQYSRAFIRDPEATSKKGALLLLGTAVTLYLVLD